MKTTRCSISILLLTGSSRLLSVVSGRLLLRSHRRQNILCRMIVQHTLMSDFTTEEEPACIPIVEGKETDNVFPLQVPIPLRDDDTLLVNITNIIYNKDETIRTTKYSTFTTVPLPLHLRRDLESHHSHYHHHTVIKETVAIVRISTRDREPSVNTSSLQNLLTTAETSFITQFDRCSAGQVQFQPAGVFNVQVDAPIRDFTKPGPLLRAAQDQLKLDLELDQGTSMTELADRIFFCLPPGTGSWVATAGMGHWRASFNDAWCLSLSATMHEMGHLLKLAHSNKNGVKYGDRTGYMSRSYRSATTPLRCFNGRQHYELGWYASRTMVLKNAGTAASWIRLAAFVDFNKTLPDDSVLVVVGDLFVLQYNRAKLYNHGTGEMANQVTITNSSQGGSELLAGLGVGDEFGRNGVWVHVCQAQAGNHKSPDVMWIRVGPWIEEDFCGSAPSARPSLAPSILVEPTIAPSVTIRPTMTPSDSFEPSRSVDPTMPPTSLEQASGEPDAKPASLFHWFMTWWQ